MPLYSPGFFIIFMLTPFDLHGYEVPGRYVVVFPEALGDGDASVLLDAHGDPVGFHVITGLEGGAKGYLCLAEGVEKSFMFLPKIFY